MNKPIYRFFTNDHRLMDELLDKATANPDELQMDHYHQFRAGLLKHIKMEEKILFPAAQKANGNIPLPPAVKLRLDHGALISLMVVPPSAQVIKVLRFVLDKHDLLEEEPGGMYDVCGKLTEGKTNQLLQELEKVAEVPVHPFNEAGYASDVARRTLLRAGFDFDVIAN